MMRCIIIAILAAGSTASAAILQAPADLVEAEAKAALGCFASSESEVACKDFLHATDALYGAGFCPRVLASSTDDYRVDWTECPFAAAPYADVRLLIEADNTESLLHHGWCYGRNDEPTAFNRWHVCVPGSLSYESFVVSGYEATWGGVFRIGLEIVPGDAEFVSNLLESRLDAGLVVLGEPAYPGMIRDRLAMTCRRGAAPRLEVVISSENLLEAQGDPFREGEWPVRLTVAQGGELVSGTLTTSAANEVLQIGSEQFSIEMRTLWVEVEGREAVVAALLGLYDEKAMRLQIKETDGPAPEVISVVLLGAPKLRDAIANLAVACGQ